MLVNKPLHEEKTFLVLCLVFALFRCPSRRCCIRRAQRCTRRQQLAASCLHLLPTSGQLAASFSSSCCNLIAVTSCLRRDRQTALTRLHENAVARGPRFRTWTLSLVCPTFSALTIISRLELTFNLLLLLSNAVVFVSLSFDLRYC